MSPGPVGSVQERLRAASLPLAVFGLVVLASVAGFVGLTGISAVEAVFWVLDPTSIELYVEHHEGPERATKVFAIGAFTALILAGSWVGESALVVAGDARRETALRDAGIERAGAVIAAIDDSNANIQIGVAVDEFAPNAHLVVRVGDEMYELTARRIGADSAVIPEVVSGTELVEDL